MSFEKILHPQARWLRKINTLSGLPAIVSELEQTIELRWANGLTHVELISGFIMENGEQIDCTIGVDVENPERYSTRTTFTTEPGGRITQLNTYAAWLDRRWPHPDRANDKIAALRRASIPIRRFPPKLIDDFDADHDST